MLHQVIFDLSATLSQTIFNAGSLSAIIPAAMMCAIACIIHLGLLEWKTH